MIRSDSHIPVTIVGGGPVGLFLGICLLKKGIGCRILEKRKEPVPDSRSLGIHPVSLELFDRLNITQAFLNKGLKIRRGIALTGKKELGSISFEDCPEPHTYILACPQFYTEEILRKELAALDDSALITDAEFRNFKISENSVISHFYSAGSNSSMQMTSKYLVGCDGKNSKVRKKASIHYSGKQYPDTYMMGDFEDTTGFGPDAAVFLPPEGLIECFPLPDNMRRWVVKTDAYVKNPDQKYFASLVRQRIGYELEEVKSTMLSSFGVQHYMAETFAKDNILLAGDAAHIVSPIGGQGMNLGWLGGWQLAEEITNALAIGNKESSFRRYTSNHQALTRKAARRAELNMVLGRKKTYPVFRNTLVKLILNTPAHKWAAQTFTMQNLREGWF